MQKKIFIFLGIIMVCIGFYKINELNYQKQRYIQTHIIQHPEMLPNSHTAKISSFGFTSMIADMYWIGSIQYIGGNVINEEYKKYLFVLLDLITDLNPYFESPYIIGQLLLPSESMNKEVGNQKNIQENILQGEKLGRKGIQNFCNPEILSEIAKQDDLQKISSEVLYKNPCKSFKIPYYLAYIYYFYLKDGVQAANYYKIVAAQEDAPSGAKVLAAIMQGKGGEREKSIFMFLSLAKSLGQEDENCSVMTEKVEAVYRTISQEDIPLTGELIAAIERDRDLIFPKLTNENEDTILGDTQCSNYLIKAIREISLLYLEQADARYKKDFPSETSAFTPEKLLASGYISFSPTDFQQYESENIGIVYKYKSDIGRFDYEMGY